MPKNIIILIILLCYINFLSAQTTNDSLLFELEKKIYAEANDTIKTNLLIGKIDIYINQNNIVSYELLTEINRVQWNTLKDSAILSRFFWNSALTFYLNQKYSLALNAYNHYQEMIKVDTTINTLFLHTLILMRVDSSLFVNNLTKCAQVDSSFLEMTCYLDIINYEKKNKLFYPISSAIIPGSGMLMLGKPKQGITSLFINSATAYAIYSLLQNNLYVNSVAWGIVLMQKFYVGGIKLTSKLTDEKENKIRYKLSTKCHKTLNVLLQKYPLNFKMY